MIRSILFACLALVAFSAPAQTANVPAVAVLTWTAPTTATDGSPLTGAQAITEYQLWASQATIPDTVSSGAIAKIAPTATNYQYSASVPNGSKLFFRMKACNLGGCGGFSAEASKVIAVAVPGVPTGVNVAITITLQVTP